MHERNRGEIDSYRVVTQVLTDSRSTTHDSGVIRFSAMTPGVLELRDFAARYTAAWCSRNPASAAAFFSEDGSLRVNDDSPAVGRTAVTQVAQSFMIAFPIFGW